jgi:preprotein translocase subunit SecF
VTAINPANPTDALGVNVKQSLWHRLTTGATNYEFVRRWRTWALFSLIIVGLGLGALLGRGLKLGLDFKGGTSWEVPAKTLSVATTRDALGPIIGRNATIQDVVTNGVRSIRVKAEKTSQDDRNKVIAKLVDISGAPKIKDPKDKTGKKLVANLDVVTTQFVGPSWGKDVTNKARQALIVFFFVIAAWVSIRFQWKMAAAAIAAVLHDVIVTVGIYALIGFEVSPATVIAFLTILGFSLYDTIVVFDKVSDNEKVIGPTGRLTYTDIVNLSMNQVLMRSLNTSLVAILPVISLLVIGAGIMGATALGDFGLALFVGLLTGAYSSIFVASPVLAWLKEREEKWGALRRRLGGADKVVGAREGAIARASIGRTLSVGGEVAGVGARSVATAKVWDSNNPRPRKKGKTR